MEFNSFVFPNPQETYNKSFIDLYRIPRDLKDTNPEAGFFNKKEFHWFFYKINIIILQTQ